MKIKVLLEHREALLNPNLHPSPQGLTLTIAKWMAQLGHPQDRSDIFPEFFLLNIKVRYDSTVSQSAKKLDAKSCKNMTNYCYSLHHSYHTFSTNPSCWCHPHPASFIAYSSAPARAHPYGGCSVPQAASA